MLTRSVFDRYRIVNEAGPAEELGKLAAAQESRAQPEAATGNVAALRTSTAEAVARCAGQD
jgi:hypothetical protein